MSDISTPRRPATFKLDDPRVKLATSNRETDRLARGDVRIMPEPDPASGCRW